MKFTTLVVGGSGALGKSVLKTFNKQSKTINVDYIESHLASKEHLLRPNECPSF